MTKRWLTLFVLTLFLQLAHATGLPKDSVSGDTKDTLVLKDIPEAATLDSAIICFYEELQSITDELSSPEDLLIPDSLPQFPDSIYQKRLADLDRATPFELSYNHIVAAFINLYMSKRRELSAKCLSRSELYFPLFEETLDRYNLPLEIKYLAVVESALDPKARSKAGATGLWQFMYGTGKNFGLNITSYVDERSDPVRSTEAAAKYLSYLYGMFGDWNLALAAYNCGEGRVTRAIRRSGGKKDYWDIYPFLPRETRGYVPAFIAVNYLFNYANEHHIYAAPTTYAHYEIDSVHLSTPLSFSSIAKALDIEESIVKAYNPVYKRDFIPCVDEGNALYLPKTHLNLWVTNEDTLLALLAKDEEKEEIAAPQDVIYYTVRSGDYLGKIASRYGCSVSQLQYWNNLRGTNLRIGQQLILYANEVRSTPQTTPSQPIKTETKGNYVYYSIRPGDTLWDIAKARGLSVDQLKRWNTGVNFNNMKPGQKIIIGEAS